MDWDYDRGRPRDDDDDSDEEVTDNIMSMFTTKKTTKKKKVAAAGTKRSLDDASKTASAPKRRKKAKEASPPSQPPPPQTSYTNSMTRDEMEKGMESIRYLTEEFMPKLQPSEEKQMIASELSRYVNAQNQKATDVVDKLPNDYEEMMREMLEKEETGSGSSSVLGAVQNDKDDTHIVRMGSGITDELTMQQQQDGAAVETSASYPGGTARAPKGEAWTNALKQSGRAAISVYNRRQAKRSTPGSAIHIDVRNAAIRSIQEFVVKRGGGEEGSYYPWKNVRSRSQPSKRSAAAAGDDDDDEEEDQLSMLSTREVGKGSKKKSKAAEVAEGEGVADDVPTLESDKKKTYGIPTNQLYVRMLASLEPYWDMMGDIARELSDSDALEGKINPPEIQPNFVPSLMSPAYGPVPECILKEDCFLYTTMVHKECKKPHIGCTFLFPDQIRLLRLGKLNNIAPGVCYYCMCIIIGVMFDRVASNGNQPHPIKLRKKNDDDDGDFTQEDEDRVHYDADRNEVTPESELRTFDGIIVPFTHPIEKPGGYKKEFVYHQGTGYTSEIVVPFRKVTTHQFDSVYIKQQWRDEPDGPLRSERLPTFREQSRLLFRLSSRDYDPQCIDPLVGMTYTVQPLTTESLLRHLHKEKDIVINAITSIGGNVDYVFPKHFTVSKQTRQRGIAILSHSSAKQLDAWEVRRNEQTKARFDGMPFDYVFTEDIAITQEHITDLLLTFGYMRCSETDTKKWIIEYPNFRMHNEDFLPEEDLKFRARYHAMHLRINVAMALSTAKKKIPGATSASGGRRTNANRLQKLSCFIQGHYKLIAHFTKSIETRDVFYLNDTTFSLIPGDEGTPDYGCRPTTLIDDLQNITMEVEEFRTYGELTAQESPLIIDPEDLAAVEVKAYNVTKDSPHTHIRRFLRSQREQSNFLTELANLTGVTIKDLCDRYLFHEFRTTVKWIKEMPPERQMGLWEHLDWCKRWCPFADRVRAVLRERSEAFHHSCSIFAAMLVRINVAEILLEEIDEEHKEVRYMLHLYGQTHLNLAVYIENNSKMVDSALCKEQNLGGMNYEKALPTPYRVYYPGQYNFEFEGTVEDMSHLCSYITFISFNVNDFGKWHYIMAKYLPKCCQKRTVDKKQDEACAENEDYYRHVCLMFYMSMMGLYRTSRNRPRFARRIAIHAYMNQLHQKSEFMDFMLQNKYLFAAVIREHLLFQMCADIAFTIVVSIYFPRWGKFLETSQEAVDLVREMYDKSGSFTGIEEQLETLIGNTQYVFRRNSNDFIGFILSRFNDMNQNMEALMKKNIQRDVDKELNPANNDGDEKKKAAAPKKRRRRRGAAGNDSDTSLTEMMLLKLAEQIKKLSTAKRNQIDKYVEHLTPCDDIYPSDLEVLGVEPSDINMLEECYDIYRQEESKKATMQKLSMFTPSGYEIIYYFFWALRTHYSLRLVHLPQQMTRMQRDAVRRKFNSDVTTPYATRCLMFSSCCCKRKSFTSQTHHISFMGAERVVQRDDGKIYCGKKPTKKQSRTTQPKRYEHLPAKERENKLAVDARKKEREDEGFVFGTLSADFKNRYRRTCIETPVRVVPGTDYVVEFKDSKAKRDSQSYTICPRCGTATRFSIDMWGPNGFTCMQCDKDKRKLWLQPRCTGCNIIRPQQTARSDQYTRWREKFMFDDRPGGSHAVQKFHFCPACAKKSVDKVRDGTVSRRDMKILLSREVSTQCELEMELYECWTLPGADVAALRS